MGWVNHVTDSIGITDTANSGSLLDQSVNIVSDPGNAAHDFGTKVSNAANDIGTAIDESVPGGLPAVAAAAAIYFGMPPELAAAGETSAGAAGISDALAASGAAAADSGLEAGLADAFANAPAIPAGGFTEADVLSGAGLGGEYAGGLGETGGLTGGVSNPADLGGADAGEYAGGLGQTGGLTGGISNPADLGGEYGTSGGTSGGFANALKNFLKGNIGGTQLTGAGALTGAAGIAGLLSLLKSEDSRYGVPGRQAYSGPLSQFKYSPSTYQPTRVDPNMFRPRAGTGISVADQQAMPQMGRQMPFMGMPQMPFMGRGRRQMRSPFMASNVPDPYAGMQDMYNAIPGEMAFAKGGSTKPKYTGQAQLSAMDPWERALAQYGNAAHAAQMPTGPVQPVASNVPELGQLNLSSGGHLGGYSDGGRLLRGPGDGVSDSIPATIGHKQPARLADGEFVVPARIVSELGNGSTEAGARQLYAMLDRVQNRRKKTVGKGKVAVNSKADKDLPA
jgi:hypothetical protein